jgi:Tfp pilus assembly protein PilO
MDIVFQAIYQALISSGLPPSAVIIIVVLLVVCFLLTWLFMKSFKELGDLRKAHTETVKEYTHSISEQSRAAIDNLTNMTDSIVEVNKSTVKKFRLCPYETSQDDE